MWSGFLGVDVSIGGLTLVQEGANGDCPVDVGEGSAATLPPPLRAPRPNIRPEMRVTNVKGGGTWGCKLVRPREGPAPTHALEESVPTLLALT